MKLKLVMIVSVLCLWCVCSVVVVLCSVLRFRCMVLYRYLLLVVSVMLCGLCLNSGMLSLVLS